MAYALSRLVRSVIVIIGVTLLVFAILRLAPGDPVALMLGQGATEDVVAELRAKLGLNSSIPVQAALFSWNAFRGDLGVSLVYQQPTLVLLLGALGYTVALGLASFALTLAIAIPAGIASAAWPRSLIAKSVDLIVLLTQAMPTFWVGMMLIFAFAVQLQILPTSGTGSWQHLVLPATTMSIFQWPIVIRTVRSALTQVLQQDYIRTARAKGAGTSRLVFTHALRNCAIPIITVLALQLGTLLSGAAITEAVFGWPGLGNLSISAVSTRDYPLIQAAVIFSAAVIVLVNLAADALNWLIDPRLRR